MPSLADGCRSVWGRAVPWRRLAVIQQLVEGQIGSVAGEVVVIAGVMIAGATAVVAQRVDEGQVMRLPGQLGQVFTQEHTGGRGSDWLEFAAVLDRGIRLEVPHVDV